MAGCGRRGWSRGGEGGVRMGVAWQGDRHPPRTVREAQAEGAGPGCWGVPRAGEVGRTPSAGEPGPRREGSEEMRV